jgi:thiamine biosynthesis lipoprotein
MMPRRQCLRWALGLFGAGLSMPALAKAAPALVWRERALLGFGTSLWLKAGHTDAGQLESALSASVAAIRQIERQMSLFDPDSALSRLNAQGQLRDPDVHLLTVLKMAREVSAASDGAFDVSMQPLWQLWSQASEHGALPSQHAIDKTRRLVNWRAIEVSPALLRANIPGMALSLNGIAQGYASDLVKSILQAHGIRHALIDTGETSLLGQTPDARAWTFGIEDAARKSQQTPPLLVADGRAIATSSDAHTVFSADHRHHHIMNPHTGYSPVHWSSVTVLAPSCTLADALTKVFFTLPREKVLPIARRWQVDVVLQDKAGHWTSTL